MVSNVFVKSSKSFRKVLSLVLVVAMTLGLTTSAKTAYAATTITSMAYYSSGDGPVLTGSGVDSASYGFVMPIFNGGAATWADVSNDMQVNVLVNGTWTDIDSVSKFIYNVNWGHWSDAGFYGFWFKLGETTQVQLQSKANPNVTLEYTLQFNGLSKTTITSMTASQTEITAGVTGSCGFVYPTFNGDASVKYEQVADDFAAYVKTAKDTDWVDLNNNAASGWIYDQNFGQFWDGPGGYWFNVTETTWVRFRSVSNPSVYVDYKLVYEKPVRTENKLSADQTTYTAGNSGELGLPLPYIDGGYPIADELDNFVYEVLVGGNWVALGDVSASDFSYQGNGYNKFSAMKQWGYWVDGIYGLWFQPITQNVQLRIGYPTNGVKGGSIGNNYVEYTLIGNPDYVYVPIPVSELELGTSDNYQVDGWDLVWNDEFNGNTLDTSKWSYNTGYYINDDASTWGWGNNELEYYTDQEKNVSVNNGKLNLSAYYEPTTFPEIDPNRVAPYSSGKVISQNKFTFKYGRVDFSAKLPTGNGIWPALWLLPNDSEYGVWAASGEIDVMEARGRINNSVSGTIHYGGSWPSNTYTGADYIFPDGQTFDDGYHVYSLVWTEDTLAWYVDGQPFSYLDNTVWYSTGAPSNPYAPFDKEFFLIMNLAVGGWFDGGITPEAGDIPATMSVDYVRVYRAANDTAMTYTDRTSGIVQPGASSGNINPTEPSTEPTEPSTEQTEPSTEPVNGNVTNQVGNDTIGLVRTNDTVKFYVNNAVFADLHYKVNNGPQQNVGMQNDGNGNFTYTVRGLQTGDTIEYFFTYNPGNGALDSAWSSFTLPATGTSTKPTNPSTEPVQTGSQTNLALHKTVTCSGLENAGFTTDALVDGNEGTRWSSNFADDAWFTIDLGQAYELNQIKLNWEGAYGKRYLIQTSTDGNQYDTIIAQNNGAGGIEEFSLRGVTARYVKLQGIERGLPYGYSLYEVEITGQEVMMTTSDIYNAAAGATVTCSGSENAGFSTAALVDEDTNTRWASNFADDAWFIIDLGAIKHFYEIELNWEAAYGKKYTISVSTDGMNYDTIVSQQNGQGGIESYDCNVSARYIKVQGIERALPYGYSLYEVQVQAAR